MFPSYPSRLKKTMWRLQYASWLVSRLLEMKVKGGETLLKLENTFILWLRTLSISKLATVEKIRDIDKKARSLILALQSWKVPPQHGEHEKELRGYWYKEYHF